MVIDDEFAIGYTLGTGRLFVDIAKFHEYAERLLGRPILTHEFGEPETWAEMREVFEGQVTQQQGGER